MSKTTSRFAIQSEDQTLLWCNRLLPLYDVCFESQNHVYFDFEAVLTDAARNSASKLLYCQCCDKCLDRNSQTTGVVFPTVTNDRMDNTLIGAVGTDICWVPIVGHDVFVAALLLSDCFGSGDVKSDL